MMTTDEKKLQEQMRALAEKVTREEEREEQDKGHVNKNGNWEKGKLPISPTRMSSKQAHYAQTKFTRLVSEADEDLMDENWVVRDGRGKRTAGRSFLMACMVDLLLYACEAREDGSELEKEALKWKDTLMTYAKERRRVRDFYPKE